MCVCVINSFQFISLEARKGGGGGLCVSYVKQVPSTLVEREHRKAIYLFQVIPCSLCGTILFGTKPICSKRMRRLVSVNGLSIR